jgi:cholesterol transport system auxiliary component
VVIRYDAQVVEVRTRRLIATRSFETRAAPTGSGVGSAVNAFGVAADALTKDVVAWVVGL